MIRVVLVDDHALVRAGIGRLLESTERFEVVGEAADGREALGECERARPDVVIMDIVMPNKDGLDATKELVARYPDTKILVLSGHGEPDYVARLLAAGASGYFTKSGDMTGLVEAIEAVVAGERRVPPGLGAVLDPGLQSLTDRELQIVRLIAEGKRNRDIAAELCISNKTVDTHRANALAKLRLETNADLTRFAMRSGLVEQV